MMNHFNRNIEIPTRYDNDISISTSLIEYETKVIEEISRIQTKLSFCIDTWSDKNKQKFIGVTMHYISNSTLKSTILDFIPCQLDNGSSIKEAFINVLEKFKCERKLFCITSDNGKVYFNK